MRDGGVFVGLGGVDGIAGTVAVSGGIEVRLIPAVVDPVEDPAEDGVEDVLEAFFAAEPEFVMIAPLPVLLEFLPGPSSQLIYPQLI